MGAWQVSGPAQVISAASGGASIAPSVVPEPPPPASGGPPLPALAQAPSTKAPSAQTSSSTSLCTPVTIFLRCNRTIAVQDVVRPVGLVRGAELNLQLALRAPRGHRIQPPQDERREDQ